MAGQSFTKRNTEDIVYEAIGPVLEGSRLVIPSGGIAPSSKLQGIGVAGDAAKNCLGVSAAFAVPLTARAALEAGTTFDGFPTLQLGIANETVTVYNRAFGDVEYTAVAVAHGAKLACAAGGKVRAWVSGDGADAIIGRCAEPGGVSSAGGWARAYINV